MIDTNLVISKIEKFAPPKLAQEWDNSGWQINLGKSKTKNVMLCLTVTLDVVKQAAKDNCDLIISHHPLFFNEFKKISSDNLSQKILIEAIKNEIQIYCAHTNLDITKGGVNDVLIEKLGIKKAKTIDDYVRIGAFQKAISLDDFIIKVKLALNTQNIKIINPNNLQKVKTVGVCSGSGVDFAAQTPVDAFITGDIKYHSAIDIQDKIVVDAGHFETEIIILPILKELIKTEAPNTIIAKEYSPYIVM